MMNKRGLELAWSTIIVLVILLVVAAVIVWGFTKYFGKEGEAVGSEIDVLECMRYGNTREQCLECFNDHKIDSDYCKKDLGDEFIDTKGQ